MNKCAICHTRKRILYKVHLSFFLAKYQYNGEYSICKACLEELEE